MLGSESAVLCVEGIDTMKDDPTAVDVLFARVQLTDSSNRSVDSPCLWANLLLSDNCRLQAFVDAVQSHVIARAPDLMKKEFDREGVKLHATLMNSRFPAAVAKTAAEREGRGVEGNWRKRENPGKIPPREPFNATKILRVCTHPQ